MHAEDVSGYARNVLDSVGDGVIVVNADGVVTLMNPAAEEMTGRSYRSISQRKFSEVFEAEPLLVEMVERTASTSVALSDQENIILESAGRMFPVNATTFPLVRPSGDTIGVILTLRDLTSIRELEAAVRQADRLSTLGTLAAGLAHEVKNPLGGIKGAAQLLERELPADSELHEYTRVMIKEAERIDRIIRQLLDFSSPRRPRKQAINLHMVLGDIILLQRETAAEQDIYISSIFDPSIPPILGDEAQITQLFLNLVRNALEAMPEGGSLTITSRVDAEYFLSRGTSRSRMVAVEISDSGCGITGEDLDKIGTPFFTTKVHGTGLGLAICQKIVAEHRGILKVRSTIGKGTTVRVLLPLVKPPVTKE